jgi:hypothetical protein
MFRIESNLAQVAIKLQTNIRRVEANWSQHLLEVAADGMTLVAHRIQQQGKNTGGEVMRTKSPRSIQAYSRAAGLLRRKKGRQTDHIDFTLEGDLMRNYNIISHTAKEVVVGFLDRGMAEIAGYLEAYFGPAFYLSESEQRFLSLKLRDKVLNDLRS